MSSDWAEKVSVFTEEIKRIFTVDELDTYFATITRVGSAAHVSTKEEYELMREAGMFDDDVVRGPPTQYCSNEHARVCSVGLADLSESVYARP